MNSILLRHRSLVALFAILAALVLIPRARAAGKDAPEELIQYIQEAQKLGLADQEIKDNAVKAGWLPAAVEAAFAKSRSSHEKTADGASQTAAPTATPASDHAPTTPGQPAARPAEAATTPDGYRIGAGDVLQIMVWKEPDASVPSVVVRPDGKIAMPLLKDVAVVGLTPKEAERFITERLNRFIRGADVTVIVTEINSTKAYVVGAVKKEGPISLQYRMTILQAISEAGGLTDYAKRKKIYLLRSESGKQYRLLFNYDAVIKGEQMEQNVPLIPGDTIVIPH